MVLTIPHSRNDSAEQILEQYRQQGPMFERFRKRVSRLLEKKGMLPLGNRWISVVESHASGHPHMNVMFQGEGICSLLRSEQKTEEPSKSGKTFHLLHGEIAAIAKACGFGRVSGDIQGCIKNALAYVLKTAKEMNKLLQLPMVAEKRFRRYRSGKGFLPKTFRQEKAEKRKAEGSLIGGCLTINSERYKARAPLAAYYAKKYSAARQFLEAARFLGFKGKTEEVEVSAREEIDFFLEKSKRVQWAEEFARATCDDPDRPGKDSYTPLKTGLEKLRQAIRVKKRGEFAESIYREALSAYRVA